MIARNARHNAQAAPQAAGSAGADVPIEEHAAAQVKELLQKFASQTSKARRAPDADAVHDLRVSIRRLRQGLRVFAQFFPARPRKRVRRRLKTLMGYAAEVRNRDIAAELLRSSGLPENAAVLRRLAGGRAQAAGKLAAALDRWHVRGTGRRWRTRLGV